MLADLNTWAISEVGIENFQAKWHVGRARPEVRVNYMKFVILYGIALSVAHIQALFLLCLILVTNWLP